MRLIVARCEVVYTGRLERVSPRIHAARAGQGGRVRARPRRRGRVQTVELDDASDGDSRRNRASLVVRKRAGKSEDRLGDPPPRGAQRRRAGDGRGGPAGRRTGSRRTCRSCLPRIPARSASRCAWSGGSGRTGQGPVDLMCRDEDGAWVAVEIKRVATIEAVEQLTRYLERIRLDPARADCRGVLAAQRVKPQAATLAEARQACVAFEWDLDSSAASARAAHALRRLTRYCGGRTAAHVASTSCAICSTSAASGLGTPPRRVAAATARPQTLRP